MNREEIFIEIVSRLNKLDENHLELIRSATNSCIVVQSMKNLKQENNVELIKELMTV